MTSHFLPHLYFETECRDAMTRYHVAFGGELEINTFGDIGMEGIRTRCWAHRSVPPWASS